MIFLVIYPRFWDISWLSYDNEVVKYFLTFKIKEAGYVITVLQMCFIRILKQFSFQICERHFERALHFTLLLAGFPHIKQ